MADIVNLTDVAANQSINDANDVYFLKEGVVHYATSGDTLTVGGTADTRTIFVDGSLISLGINGVDDANSAAPVNNVTIVVSDTGSITSTPSHRGILLDGDRTVILNNGEIAAGEAIRLGGELVEVYNTGTITGIFNINTATIFTVIFEAAEASFINGGTVMGTNGVIFQNSFFLNNTGSILAENNAINVLGTAAGARTLINSGTISAVSGFAYDGTSLTEEIRNTGTMFGDIDLSGGADILRNAGTILGDIELGSDADADLFVNGGTITGDISGTGLGADTIRNSGTLTGSISLDVGGDLIVNTGTIEGDISVQNGEDRIVNLGTIVGDMSLGGSDDTYRAFGDGTVTGSISGDAGDDMIFGGAARDEVYGGDDGDLIRGQGGNDDLFGDGGIDRVFGGAGNDLVYGGDGADVLGGDDGDDNLFGQDGADVLFGGRGDDFLYGGLLDDRLFGGAGNDLLEGSLGRDQMYGGAGNDEFLFTTTADSPDTTQRDVIFDFTAGEDVINVTQLAGPAFDFVGTGAFTGTGGEVRYQVISTGANVYVDADGDGSADMRIFLDGVATLTADDFIL